MAKAIVLRFGTSILSEHFAIKVDHKSKKKTVKKLYYL